jgi:predicted glycogen debranching enzyme
VTRRPEEPVRRIAWPPADAADADALVSKEWLVTNGLGGYASGTVQGAITRRYHGLLVAALAAPLGRVVMLSQMTEQIEWPDGRRAEIGGRESNEEETAGSVQTAGGLGTGFLSEFRLQSGLPIWRYEVDGVILEKRLFLSYRQNTVHVVYELLAGPDSVGLALRPSVNFRAQEAPVSEPLASPYEFRSVGERCEIVLRDSVIPSLNMVLRGEDVVFTLQGKRTTNVLYPVEESRGYQARGDLWSPGYYKLTLTKNSRATFVASTEPFDIMLVLDSEHALTAERHRRQRLLGQAVPAAREGIPAELVLAADQFIVTPAGRVEEAARAQASGDEVRTVIAGYHWFTDWGRDTMISLEGLTLLTGRALEAGYILRTFAHYVRDGLIPNMFPEREKHGLYHTADATLWFFHAISRYLAFTNDDLLLTSLYPTLRTIVDAHLAGTDFGIHVDPADGLLAQGAPGYQLTWMDAKVDDWVVTPRRGKAVEINALWYNALRLMHGWALEMGDGFASQLQEHADRAERSFNQKFWNPTLGCLFDVVDVEQQPGVTDAKIRPNQILAVSLPHPVLARECWGQVVQTVHDQLLTPVGLRSLAPQDPSFKPRYFGDLRARDAAYHEGTVWAWLIGPFVDAWLKVHPDDTGGVKRALDGFLPHFDDGCIGSVSEIFDAERPFTARGCIAQAWSVAELLRAWLKLKN